MKTRQDIRTPLLLGRRLPAKSRPTVGFVTHQAAVAPNEHELVTYDGTGHLLTLGPTGSGKTSQAICNALNYGGSIIVFDSTGGIYESTARRRREMGQEVHIIDLRDRERAGEGSLNPLDLAAREPWSPPVSTMPSHCRPTGRT